MVRHPQQMLSPVPEWSGTFPMAWTTASPSPVPRRAHFRRPAPDVLPGLLVGEYEGTRIPLHTYEALLLVLPTTRFVVLGGAAAVPTGPGDICLSNMLELHGAMGGAMRCHARVLLVSPDLLSEIGCPRFGRTPLPDPWLAQAFSLLWEELQRPVQSNGVVEKCRALLHQLVERHGGADPPVAGKPADRAIQEVLAHLQRHVAEPQALHRLADLARVGKSYLVREFHRSVGLPPHAYHLQLRIARAARLLGLGLPLSRAAFEAGFADQSHLSRKFKAAYGLTPLSFARAVRPAPAPWARPRSHSSSAICLDASSAWKCSTPTAEGETSFNTLPVPAGRFDPGASRVGGGPTPR
jgi:AraC-like DNA-binding protein